MAGQGSVRAWLRLPDVRAAILTEEAFAGLPEGRAVALAEVDPDLGPLAAGARPERVLAVRWVARDGPCRTAGGDVRAVYPVRTGAAGDGRGALVVLAGSPHVWNGATGDGASRFVPFAALTGLPPLPPG